MVAEKNRYQSPDQEFTKDSHLRTIEFLESEIKLVEALMRNAIKGCNYVTESKDLLIAEVVGLGEVTATSLLALIPELGKV